MIEKVKTGTAMSIATNHIPAFLQENEIGARINHLQINTNFNDADIQSLLANNAILRTIVSIRYASNPNEKFTFPYAYPINLSDVLLNPILLALPNIFTEISYLGYSDKGTITDIYCGQLTEPSKEIYQKMRENSMIEQEAYSFFIKYPTTKAFSPDRDNPSEYQIMLEKQIRCDNSIVEYLLWAMLNFSLPLCTLPYYNRTISMIESDAMLPQLASCVEEMFVIGSNSSEEWKSHQLVFKNVNKNIAFEYKNKHWAR